MYNYKPAHIKSGKTTLIQNNLNPKLDIPNSTEQQTEKKDKITISQIATESLKQQTNISDKLHDFANDIYAKTKGSTKEDENKLDALLLCLQIAARIMQGDDVPKEDIDYIIEHEPGMYGKAIIFRQQNDEPKEYDSLLEEDENDNQVKELNSVTRKYSGQKGTATFDNQTHDINVVVEEGE